MKTKSVAKHTPGPWTCDEISDLGFYEVIGGGGVIVEPGSAYPSGLADARLIAAAPDLLAILKGGHVDDDGVICSSEGRAHNYPCAACEVIAKAEGGK